MKILHYNELTAQKVDMKDAKNVTIRWLISKDDGAKNFAMRFFVIGPGGKTPLHTHKHEHEVFIIEGEGAVWRDGNEVALSPGTAVFVPPDEKHCFINKSDKTLKFLCLIPIIS